MTNLRAYGILILSSEGPVADITKRGGFTMNRVLHNSSGGHRETIGQR